MTNHGIDVVIAPRTRSVGAGHVRRLLPWRLRRMVGPFIFADMIGPEVLGPGAAMNVDAHPHIGLSTVTYFVSDHRWYGSEHLPGRVVHRDSTGAVQVIEPGAVNWMTAGAGVTHTERSHPDDVDRAVSMLGLQTWVALPEDAEDGPPGFEHCAADGVPTTTLDGASVRLAVGTGFGMSAPIAGSSTLVLAELLLDGGAAIVAPEHSERAVLAMAGEVTVAGQSLANGHLAVLAPGASVHVGGRGVAMVLGGEPVGPRLIWWNFVHSRQDAIDAAKHAWIDQRFPRVPDDHDPWVPLPGS